MISEGISPLLLEEKYLGDGYPRTIDQAKSFEGLLNELGVPLHAVLWLDANDDNCMVRLEQLYF